MNPLNTVLSQSYSMYDYAYSKYALIKNIYKTVISPRTNQIYSFGNIIYNYTIEYTFLNTTELKVLAIISNRNTFEITPDGKYVFFISYDSPHQLIQFDIGQQSIKNSISMLDMKCGDTSTIVMKDNSTLFFNAVYVHGAYGVLCKYNFLSGSDFTCEYNENYGISSSLAYIGGDVFVHSALSLNYYDHIKLAIVTFDDDNRWKNDIYFNGFNQSIYYHTGSAGTNGSQALLYRIDIIDKSLYYYTVNMTTGEVANDNTFYQLFSSQWFDKTGVMIFNNHKLYVQIVAYNKILIFCVEDLFSSNLYYVEKKKNSEDRQYSSISLSLPAKIFYSIMNTKDSEYTQLYEIPINSPNAIQNFDMKIDCNVKIMNNLTARYESEFYSNGIFPFESGIKVEVSSVEYVNHYTKVSNISYNLEPCNLQNNTSDISIHSSD